MSRIIGLTSVLFVLGACGGGSSGSGESGSQPPPPSTPTYSVTTSAAGSGSISPTSRDVSQGSSTSFTISPEPGSTIASVSGCGGSLSGNTYTTGPINNSCTVSVTFTLKTYTVTATAGSGGSISPSSIDATHGGTTTFTVTPNSGHTIEAVSGCGGSLSGNTYTTDPIVAACSVTAAFSLTVPDYGYSGVGLAIWVTTDDGVNISTVSGETSRHSISVYKADPDIPVRVSIEGSVPGVSLEQSGEGHFIAVDGSAIAGGTSVPIKVIAENREKSQGVSTDVVVNVIDPVLVASGSIDSGGGGVSSPGGAIGVQFNPGQLSSRLGVNIYRALTPSGMAKIRVKFDRNVSNESAEMSLTYNLGWDNDLAGMGQKNIAGIGVHAPRLSKSNLAIDKTVADYAGLFLEGTDIRVIKRTYPVFQWLDGSYAGSTPNTACGINTSTVCVSLDPKAATLTSSKPLHCFDLSPQDYLADPACSPSHAADGQSHTGFAPVLFIHGFKPGGGLGGGPDTWNDFPFLVSSLTGPNGEEVVPFEFRWRTNTAFQTAANDLAGAISRIYGLTKRPVRIVAHSMGGLLARTLLQNLNNSSLLYDQSYVHSVLTIGTPHSGIFDERTPGAKFGQSFPDGQGAFWYKFCGQVSCYQAGEAVSFSQTTLEMAGAGDFGELIEDLAHLAEHPFPSQLPFVVAIGLAVVDGDYDKYDDGDKLISFNGQRFLPRLTQEYSEGQRQSDNLLLCNGDETVGLVTEVVLGPLDEDGTSVGQPQPYSTAPFVLTTAGSARARGYSHSNNILQHPDNDLEYAEPFVSACDASDGTCQEHAAFSIFRKMLTPVQTGQSAPYCLAEAPPIDGSSPAVSLLGYRMEFAIEYPAKGSIGSVPFTVEIEDGLEILGGEIQDANDFDSTRIILVNQDIGGDYIKATYLESTVAITSEFNGYVYKFEDQSPTITRAWLDPSSDFDASQIQVEFSEHTVWVNVSGLRVGTGQQFLVRLELSR